MNFAEKYGPWAVIGGASEGTGRSFSKALASQGVNCILLARREGPLTSLAQELELEHGIECLCVTADLSMPNAIERIVLAIGSREVGLLIWNAGADTASSHFLDQELAAWSELINRNVNNVVASCHHFAKAMRQRGHGGILIVGSGACYGGASFMAAYAGSKAFELCFTEGLWAELKPQGVDVLNLILGRTDTPAFRDMLAQQGLPIPDDLAKPADIAKTGLEQLPNGPVCNWGQAEDVAGIAPNSAAARRARILAIDEATKTIFKRSQ